MVQILSFGSSVALAVLLGASTSTDAYYLALSVPTVAYAVLLAAIRLGGVPKLTEIAHSESPESFTEVADELVSCLTFAAVVIAVVATAVMVVVLPAAAGTSHQLTALTRRFMIELTPYTVTGAALGALGAVLAVRGKFVAATLVLGIEPVLKSVLLLLFHHQLGAQALVIGNLAGNFLAVAVLWNVLRRDGVRLSMMRVRASPAVRSVLKLSAPLLISMSVLQLNPLIDRAAAAGLGTGSVTVFELGVRLFMAPASLLVATLAAPLAATWAARLADTGWHAVTASFARVVTFTSLAVPPIVAVGIVFRKQLVTLAYSSHAYTPTSVSRTATVLGILLLALPAQILIQPMATLFIIRKDSILPMKVGITNAVLNAILDILLRGPLGVGGIALSTTLTLWFLCVVYVWAANRRWGLAGVGRMIARPVVLSAISTTVIALAGAAFLQVAGPTNSRLDALLALVVGAAIAVVVTWSTITLGTRGARQAEAGASGSYVSRVSRSLFQQES